MQKVLELGEGVIQMLQGTGGRAERKPHVDALHAQPTVLVADRDLIQLKSSAFTLLPPESLT